MSTLRTLWVFWLMHFRGSFRHTLRRFTWEMGQTFLGFWAGCSAILRYRVEYIGQFDGVIVLGYAMGRQHWGGMCLGSVILGDLRIRAEVNNHLFMHEFGHSLQSRDAGPLYLFKFGFPSLRSAMSRGLHYLHPVEQDANLRALAYFSQVPGFKNWIFEYNPIMPGAKLLPICWWEYIPLVFPLWPLWLAFHSQKMIRSSSLGNLPDGGDSAV